jgi:hypothetical protein
MAHTYRYVHYRPTAHKKSQFYEELEEISRSLTSPFLVSAGICVVDRFWFANLFWLGQEFVTLIGFKFSSTNREVHFPSKKEVFARSLKHCRIRILYVH